jgi:hypothetical protein
MKTIGVLPGKNANLFVEANLKLAENNIYLLQEAFINGVADNQT